MKPRASGVRGGSGALGARYYRVRELVGYVRELLAADATLADVWVAGEISELTQSTAGHLYFTIRDQDARIPAVMFRSAARRQTLPITAGYQALVHGTVGYYEQRSTVQVIADVVLPGDAGRLRAEFEALRARLDEEGLFAPERKRALPRLPRRIGIVTSESGAVIHDMINVWTRRYRALDLVVAATAVQGENAPRQIAAAFGRLHEFHLTRAPLDLVILARGGGAAEELAVFNDERVARAIFACPVPVVSAVGHEVDITIADLVADVRAPTPSAAAEVVVPDSTELSQAIQRLSERSATSLARHLALKRSQVATATQHLERRSPVRLMADRRRDVDLIASQATRTLQARLALARTRVQGATAELEALGPLATLQRGFAIATRERDGHVLMRPDDAAIGDTITVRLAEGAIRAETLSPPRRQN